MAYALTPAVLIFYVYALFNPDTGEPFYIGKGKDERCEDHVKQAHRCRNQKEHLIHSYSMLGVEIPVVKIRENLSSDEALALETLLISIIKRQPDGPLLNLTAGGDGLVDPSPEAIANMKATHRGMSGRNHSEATKAKMRAAAIGKKKSPESVTKMAESLRGRALTAEHRQKVSEGMRGKKRGNFHTDITKAIISKKNTGLAYHQDPDYRAKLSVAVRAAVARRRTSQETAS